jgi:cytochrome c-type biogenesis protein CcmH
MSLTPLGWLLIVVVTGAVAVVFVARRRLAKAEAARVFWPTSGARIMPMIGGFLIVTALGYAVAVSRDTPAPALTETGDRARDAALSQLARYAEGTGATAPAPEAPAQPALPDVETMIERLAARLAAAPDNVDGWRMLGWSYANTGRHEQAAAAYAKAMALDPAAADLKVAYDEAKAQAAGRGEGPAAAAASTPGTGVANPHSTATAPATAVRSSPDLDQSAAIRSMVDGLAARLETSPHDVDGWARLMRSRVVLGEPEAATAALRRALDVFKDDAANSARIAAAAAELGLDARR